MTTVPVRLLAFCGSSRRGSWNRQLLAIAAAGARQAGATVTLLDLKDLNLPIFDEDLEAEQGLPAGAVGLKRMLRQHDGLLLACPEYNGSITPLLKNALDWASRPEPGNPPSAYAGLTAALFATSPGRLGGLRGLSPVREVLQNLGVLVLPQSVSIPSATSAFDDQGQLVAASQTERVQAHATELVRVTAALLARP
jgi:NAD(P)H-dependent FMN reductase